MDHIKKVSGIILLILFTYSCFGQKKRILIVSTNRDTVGIHASGTFLKEIAFPFQHFTDKGYEVDIVTPKGGKAAIYHWGNTSEELQKIQTSELFQTKTSSTLSPDQVNPHNYISVFYPGGHGQYFDVVHDERIGKITTAIYERGGVIGTAGHGVASLIEIRLSNGNYLVAGKKMTCFPHWAELAFMSISNYGKLLAFDMEEVLRRRGAQLVVCTPENRSNDSFTHVSDVQNHIVTGAFATSAQWVAEQMLFIIQSNNK